MAVIIQKIILADADALAHECAAIFAKIAQSAVEARGKFIVCLSGGGTPLSAYQLLARPEYKSLPWQKMIFFWGDERCVPADDPESNFNQANQALLSHVPIMTKNIQRMPGELPTAQAISGYAQNLARYGQTQRPWPRFDLLLLGLGADGHIASLTPGSPGLQAGSPPVITAQMNYQGRPAERLTLTLPVFNSAREVLFLVSGAGKSAALTTAWDETTSPQQAPARLVKPTHGRVRWLVDKAAAGE